MTFLARFWIWRPTLKFIWNRKYRILKTTNTCPIWYQNIIEKCSKKQVEIFNMTESRNGYIVFTCQKCLFRSFNKIWSIIKWSWDNFLSTRKIILWFLSWKTLKDISQIEKRPICKNKNNRNQKYMNILQEK